jgi:DeoR/GlpR family transcriptional regulator of sugar metabolism
MNKDENLLKVERLNRIRKFVDQQGVVTVSELSKHFDVSEATIRRDLEELNKRGWIRRTHGGALRVERATREPPILLRLNEQSEEKQRIGKAAAHLIQDNETIFLGSGTTVLEIARNLPEGIHLTVITNSLPVVNQLSKQKNIELIVIGGMFRQSELSMVGHVAEQAILEFRADRVFLGIHAVSVRHGLTNDFMPETMTDRAILQIAPQIILVADHSKFGRVSSVLVGSVTEVDTIITDNETPQEIITDINELGIKVIQV